MSRMSINDVKKFIPHRYPFLMVDRVLSLELNKSITAIKNVTVNEAFFNGHFPVRPVLPGVLMIEALAQTGGVLMAKSLGWPEYHKNICFLAGVDKVRFKRIVEPGDQLNLYVEIAQCRGVYWKFAGKATVNGELACSAEIKTMRNEGDI